MPGTFNVDHTQLNPGIYCAGTQVIGDRKIVTLDIRVTTPYKEEPLSVTELHTVEHMLAVELDKHCEGTDINKVYWGPMGCQTGFYLLLDVPKDYTPKEVISVLMSSCEDMLKITCDGVYNTPANSEIECGNCRTLFKDITRVKWIIYAILGFAVSVNLENNYFKYKYI